MVNEVTGYLSSFTIDETHRVCKILKNCLPTMSKNSNRAVIGFLKWLHGMFENSLSSMTTLGSVKSGPVLSSKDIPKPSFELGGRYMASSFVHQIEHTSTWFVKHKLNIKMGDVERSVVFNIVFLEDKIRSDAYYQKKAFEMVEKMTLWLNVVTRISKSRCSKRLSVYLYLLDEKKALPSEATENIGPVHANSAFADVCGKNSSIVIYRKEEWLKVFIHETFHAFGLDYAEMDLSQFDKFLSKMTGLQMDFGPTEMYAETWARILNVCLTAYYCTSGRREFVNSCISLLTCERAYSMYQCVKILNSMGIAAFQMFSKDKQSVKHRQLAYGERTHIFSYYIATAVLMNNYGGFIHFCEVRNKQYLPFDDSKENLRAFANYFRSLYENEDIIDLFDCIEMCVERNTRARSRLRMSLIELG